MILKKFLITIAFLLALASTCFATDKAAKEDTTPPAAEEALTLDQIKPIMTVGKPATTTPPPETTPQTRTAPAITTPQQTSMNMPEDLMVLN